MTLLARESCRVSPEIRFVILDEPLTHLDRENITYQLQTLQQIQNHYCPAMLVISHHFIEEMKAHLPKVTELNL